MAPEPLNIEQPQSLVLYLRSTGRIGADEAPRIEKLTGGVSNRTVLVQRANGEAWVLKQALSKLRVPVDWFSNPERIHREAEGLRWLAQLAPSGTITPLIFEDTEHHLIAMKAVPEPHENWKTLLLSGHVRDSHVTQFAKLLGTIHANAPHADHKIKTVFNDRSFFESLRLEPYYRYTATRVPEATEFLHGLIEDTLERRLTLVHGDYSPKNILIYENRLILLDHEVIHFGDPAFDLGFCLTHFLSKAHHVTHKREIFRQAADLLWKTYLETVAAADWIEGFEGRVVRHTLACLLARAKGRSQLEYLSREEKNRQKETVVELIPMHHSSVQALIREFVRRISERCTP